MDTSAAWKRLTGGDALTVEECEALARRDKPSHAPTRTSKAERRRQVELTRIAAELLSGDTKSIRYPTTVDAARKRCLEAIRADIPT